GIEVALADGDAADVLEWAERWRATGLRLPSAPTTDPELIELTARLRQAVVRIQDAGPAGPRAAGTADLERAVRDRARQLGGSGAHADDLRVPALRAAMRDLALRDPASGDAALVEYVMLGAHRCAVV
ncbi:hypothetical protein, partial [Escherichia coli]|uniref:hypothetical protein n=1 Tax=Escherichia coli TaxID=562 RepID=UPI003133254B